MGDFDGTCGLSEELGFYLSCSSDPTASCCVPATSSGGSTCSPAAACDSCDSCIDYQKVLSAYSWDADTSLLQLSLKVSWKRLNCK